jgi:hypothetical protein
MVFAAFELAAIAFRARSRRYAPRWVRSDQSMELFTRGNRPGVGFFKPIFLSTGIMPGIDRTLKETNIDQFGDFSVRLFGLRIVTTLDLLDDPPIEVLDPGQGSDPRFFLGPGSCCPHLALQ